MKGRTGTAAEVFVSPPRCLHVSSNKRCVALITVTITGGVSTTCRIFAVIAK